MSSPQVKVQEIDQSSRVASLPGGYGAIVVQSKKGPVNVPRLVTTDSEFLSAFTPNSRIEVGYDLAHFSALTYLQKSNKLWTIRAAKQALYGAFSLKKVGFTGTSSIVPLTAGLSDPTAYEFDSGPDIAAISEVASITCTADIAKALNDKYFLIDKVGAAGYEVRLKVTGETISPALPGRTQIVAEFAEGATAAVVAASIANALIATGAYTCANPANIITVTNVVAGLVAHAVDGDTSFAINLITAGADAVSQIDEAILFYSESEGAFANDIALKVTTYATDPDAVKEPNAFLVEIFRRGNESTPVESFVCSRNPSHLDGYGKNIFVEEILKSSAWIRAISNSAVPSDVQPADLVVVTYMTYGNDGLAVTDAEMVIAINTLQNKDDFPVRVVMDGGFTTPAYQVAIIALCEFRQDCYGLLSTPIAAEASLTYVADIVLYRKSTLNANSSYAGIYTPHVQIFDQFNNRKVYIGPDAFVAGVIAQDEETEEIWYAPAGYRRGVINAVDVRRRLSLGERDALYDVGVNPLRYAPGKGIAIFGQKTLLSRPSALDRANVRLLLIKIEPEIANLLEDFTFEFNDEQIRTQISDRINDYMNTVKANRGVYEFQTVCDATNNTAQVIDNNELIVDLLLKPTKSAEFIKLRVTITATSTTLQVVG